MMRGKRDLQTALEKRDKKLKKMLPFPRRESNPGRGGESAES